MAKIVNPALFIGLGGTGSKVLLQVKKALLKNYGEVPPMTKLLCFDTDRRELLSSTEEITYNKKNGSGPRTVVTEKIQFDNNEIIGIPLKNPIGLIQFPYIQEWLSDSVKPKIGPSDTGAKQIRQMGRFAIFENFRVQNIQGKINDKISELKAITQSKNLDYSLGDDNAQPCIHLVFSPCGGTGAGTFIDMVMIIKNIDPSMPIYGYMVMPDFYTSFPMTNSVIANAYASLIEIDHLMGQDADAPKAKKWSNYSSKSPFEVDYSGNSQKIILPGGSQSFFEYLYLFDNINEKNRSIRNVDDVYDRIGRILYLMVSGPGTKMQSAYSNNKDFYTPSSKLCNYKRRNYSSMGISQIILDRNFLKRLKINQITAAILNAYHFTDQETDTSSYNTFIDANSWREDNGNDMIIDRMMPRSQLKYDLDTLYPSKYKKGEWNVEVKNNVDAFLRNWDERTISNCTRIKDEILVDFSQKLSGEISKYISNRGGISQCKQFLTYIIGSFGGMADEMVSESIAHKSNIEKFNKDIQTYIEAIIQEENAFNPIGRERKVKEVTEPFIKHCERILLEKWQKTRKDNAKLFYDICIESLRKSLNQIEAIGMLLLEVTSDLERENQNIRNSSNTENDFERYIHYYYKELLNNNKSDINLEEAFRGIDFTSILKFNKVTDIKNLVQNFVVTTNAIQTIDQLTVESILKKLDKDTIKNIISYLDASSSVCIDVDSTSFLLTTDKSFMEKFGFICVENEKETIFTPDSEFYKHISAEGGYSEGGLSLFGTQDPDRITMIKIAGMFPACAIRRINGYRERFRSSSLNHYSSNYFEKYAQDLIDGPNNEADNLKWFTVGSALGKIYLHKGGIYLEYKNKQDMIPLFEGTRGKTDRFQCSKLFIKNQEYVNHISDYYNKFYDEKGKPGIKEKFIWFYKNITSVEILGKLLTSMDPKSDEYRNISVEKELLKTFGMENGIRPDEFGEE